jgi:phosphatidylglycerophosphatase A
MTSPINQDPALRRLALRTPEGWLAFGFGSGLSRYAPGTAGTVLAVPLGLLLISLPPGAYWSVLLLSFLLGIYVCGVCSEKLGAEDPGAIVWDEMVAFWLTVAFVPLSWSWWLAAFVLFRFFDIVKPWPIRTLERRLHGGLGIMFDDVIAAVYAMIILALAVRLF